MGIEASRTSGLLYENETTLTIKVCLLVPAVALVDQQTASLTMCLRKMCSVVGLAGADMVGTEDKLHKILSHHVCVMTPAIFLWVH